ncbi:zinc transport system substrate-binding protein [Enterococcus haemoperoxidus ATCC BAA-382]|uniref:Zinc transport system substrate-binding protein n=1 Tax=Enterococcus haemoperoxidus ATCC BAA-382 TaxID=1158608 RepID=R2SVJ7_9ENTE|nr:metal ABC transporter substrate-binding protein [Enterococcus haemoperoxidus]EOH96821.1 zinc transport system substrate-binding protein [Enterococcus haemoperoxidus ATCC BAA-382]EOT60110.1 zinc transport system substrate-binding protein [Enterococcus haemoperoxidus ATCC BAA-382]OJG51778.1 zinc transport system substrate-binding protein [Enterococcus haemoperoxidus]
MRKNSWKYIVGILLMAVMVTLTACGQTKEQDNSGKSDKIKVVTTFYPMYDFAKNVVGDAGDVQLLIPAGTEPHDYEPSAKDIAKITDADVFVYNSHELETWVKDVLENVDEKKVAVVEAAGSIDLMAGAAHEHDHDGEEADHDEHDHDHELDPHVWLDPVLAQKEVEAIRDALVEKYPDKKETFEKNATAYIEKLKELDTEYKEAFASAKNKTFVTQHAAFGYLAKQYGLTQESIAGISPDQEPSPSRLAELKKYIKEHNVSVIYFETSASSKVAETLARETNVELAVLNPLESITQKEQDKGEDYISVMKANLEALKKSIK